MDLSWLKRIVTKILTAYQSSDKVLKGLLYLSYKQCLINKKKYDSKILLKILFLNILNDLSNLFIKILKIYKGFLNLSKRVILNWTAWLKFVKIFVHIHNMKILTCKLSWLTWHLAFLIKFNLYISMLVLY